MKQLLRGTVFVVMVGAIIFFLAHSRSAGPREKLPEVFDCKVLRAEIQKELDLANTCDKDSDCKVVSLGGPYTELGCHKYIRQNVNQVRLYEKVERYYNSCYEKIDHCERLTKPVCRNHKCVAD